MRYQSIFQMDIGVISFLALRSRLKDFPPSVYPLANIITESAFYLARIFVILDFKMLAFVYLNHLAILRIRKKRRKNNLFCVNREFLSLKGEKIVFRCHFR